MRLVDFIDFQNNRSSAPPIVMMDGEASVGYILFWVTQCLLLEANDEMRIMTRKMMRLRDLFYYSAAKKFSFSVKYRRLAGGDGSFGSF